MGFCNVCTQCFTKPLKPYQLNNWICFLPIGGPYILGTLINKGEYQCAYRCSTEAYWRCLRCQQRCQQRYQLRVTWSLTNRIPMSEWYHSTGARNVKSCWVRVQSQLSGVMTRSERTSVIIVLYYLERGSGSAVEHLLAMCSYGYYHIWLFWQTAPFCTKHSFSGVLPPKSPWIFSIYMWCKNTKMLAHVVHPLASQKCVFLLLVTWP